MLYMISVLNHLLPLNGSKIILIISIGLFYAGCGIFKPAGKTPERPSDVTSEERVESPVVEPIDTIEWVLIPESEITPIRSRRTPMVTKFKDTYNLVLLAPFNAGAATSFSARTNQLIHFYSGVRYGLTYHTPDIDIKLTVIDTDDELFSGNLESIPAIRDADVFIGPYFSQDLERFADYAKAKQKILISPWNSETAARENPFFIQLRPSLSVHSEKITEYVLSRFRLNEIKLVCKNSEYDKSVLRYFQRASQNILADDTLHYLPELVIDNISDRNLFGHLRVLIQEQDVKAFIVPNWQDPSFILSFLSKLNFAKADSVLEVYGFPQWIDMERMDYSYYENLNVHVTSSSPMRYSGSLADQFRKDFFSIYGTLPETDAYYGFDVIRLISFLLKHEGTLIINGLTRALPDDLFNQFEFQGRFGVNGESIDYFENVFVRMYRFNQFRFYPVD